MKKTPASFYASRGCCLWFLGTKKNSLWSFRLVSQFSCKTWFIAACFVFMNQTLWSGFIDACWCSAESFFSWVSVECFNSSTQSWFLSWVFFVLFNVKFSAFDSWFNICQCFHLQIYLTMSLYVILGPLASFFYFFKWMRSILWLSPLWRMSSARLRVGSI